MVASNDSCHPPEGVWLKFIPRMGPMVAAKTPEEINDLFIRYMREGDMDSVLSLYDDEVAFANREGVVKLGKDALRQELASFVQHRQVFEFDIRRVIRAGDVALVHNLWSTTSPPVPSGYALEVARRQPDGSWRWLIGEPFTVRG
jgi:ketosteroid isomerase-like protein